MKEVAAKADAVRVKELGKMKSQKVFEPLCTQRRKSREGDMR